MINRGDFQESSEKEIFTNNVMEQSQIMISFLGSAPPQRATISVRSRKNITGRLRYG